MKYSIFHNTIFSLMEVPVVEPCYRYKVKGLIAMKAGFEAEKLEKTQWEEDLNFTSFSGFFKGLPLKISHKITTYSNGCREAISLENIGSLPVWLENIEIGILLNLDVKESWRLCAIPFRVQLDGSVHDYSVFELSEGKYKNAVFTEPSRPEPPLEETGILRSEAWAWYQESRGFVVLKYNPQDIELSVVKPIKLNGESVMLMGGAGFCLYGEPTPGHNLAPGQEFRFGETYYLPFDGGLNQAFESYRSFLDSRGHGFPSDYDPPVHWNELYDIGWYHSDADQLAKNYTREALLKEAEKAKACHCEQLYLDPGWEIAEGTSLWDESRLGSVDTLIETLQNDYGIGLAFRTILRCYRDHWPERYRVMHANGSREPVRWTDQILYEVCLCNPEFWQEKIKRIISIAQNGVRFIMVDEMDWRGPCFDPQHGHSVPSTPLEHVMAVYLLSQEIRKACPGLVTEVHDPVWPWSNAIYVPTYFRQGFGKSGMYDENWGFEYMWTCIDDLKSGKALALYYYNLGCNIPLYLHITMAADNDQNLFFWWAASTVRHLGIGGQHSHPSVEPGQGLPVYDPVKRFDAYQRDMQIYRRLKPYFVRGVFHGITENIHFHTLPGESGGVVVVFNLTETTQIIEFTISRSLLATSNILTITGAKNDWDLEDLHLSCEIPALSPKIIEIGTSVFN